MNRLIFAGGLAVAGVGSWIFSTLDNVESGDLDSVPNVTLCVTDELISFGVICTSSTTASGSDLATLGMPIVPGSAFGSSLTGVLTVRSTILGMDTSECKHFV